jgi:alkanesulfonate monooxygenase SsuD/methylene tetrahydromethanopterin reductase-like flavin-dependent oxidoreductase (luciferase family)
MGIAARHADIVNNLAVTEGELGLKVEALHRRRAQVGRDPAAITVSQQTIVVIGQTEADAAEHLAKAAKVYGGHLGAASRRTASGATRPGSSAACNATSTQAAPCS